MSVNVIYGSNNSVLISLVLDWNTWNTWSYITLCICITNIYRRCPWCNGYRRTKWTRWHEFKSWTWLMAFHKALIPNYYLIIQLFSTQLWVNSRLVRQLVKRNENSEFKLDKLRLKNDHVSYPTLAVGKYV